MTAKAPHKAALNAQFDETPWHGTVERARVSANGSIRFVFKDGHDIHEALFY